MVKKLGIFFLVAVVAITYFFINPREVAFLPRCPFYSITGFYCAGCGSQRALHDLVHLDILGVIKTNLLLLLGLVFIAYHLVITFLNTMLKKNFKSLVYHKNTPIIVLLMILSFWILRNIPIYPFTFLAPK